VTAMERNATDTCLDGLRIVELGDGVAGSVAATTLAMLGADVTKVVGPVRQIEEIGPAIVGEGLHIGALAVAMDVTKRLVTDVDRDEYLDAADIVIDDRCGFIPLATVKPFGDPPVRLTITPFGLDGPYSDRPGGERTVQAAGGLLATVSTMSGDVPVPAPSFVALRVTGHVAALAALHGLDRYRSGGVSVHVDVSAQEAVVFTCALPECAHALFRCPGKAGSGRYLAPSGLFPCLDGWVRIAAIEDHQWSGLVACLDSPAWTRGLEGRAARIEHSDVITEKVEAWTETQYKAACAQRLQESGVPATPVNGPQELLASPQFDYRHVFTQDVASGIPIRIPGPPWQSRTSGSRPTGAQGIAALRVLELTHVLAGPIVGELLGAMGANVVRLEDLDRLDIYRRNGPFADGRPGLERGAYFAVANHSKKSIAVSGEAMPAVADALLKSSDVVVENIGSARLKRLGIDPNELADRLGIVTLRVSGFGSDGPLAGYRVYANNVQAYGGLALATADVDGHPARLGSVLADPLSSVVAATVIAAWSVSPNARHGVCIDLSMAEVIMGLITEDVIAASSSTFWDQSGVGLGPRGVYRCRDGGWIALDVRSERDRSAIAAALNSPSLLPSRPERSPSQSSWRQFDAIVSDVIGAMDERDVLDRLSGQGVPASSVLTGDQLIEDPHLRDRRFFPSVRHADSDLGWIRVVGMPWRFVGEEPLSLSPPPVLGSANEEFNVRREPLHE
jgi:crotonobetainyl-CoA:carnitine CoA-transferase CaiB-like acyl-CoA transferase